MPPDPPSIQECKQKARFQAESLSGMRCAPTVDLLSQAVQELKSAHTSAGIVTVWSLNSILDEVVVGKAELALQAHCLIPVRIAAKPFAPERVGLWLLPDATGEVSISLGRHKTSTVGRDLLGWWIIPIALVISILSLIFTYRYDLRFIRQLMKRRRDRSA